MRSLLQGCRLFLLLIGIAASLAYATATLDKAALIGTWDYTSYTTLQKGKPSGIVHFAPGTLVFTYRENGTWEMEAANSRHTRHNGTFEVKGNELIMKNSDGSSYQDFQVEMSDDKNEMTMRDHQSIVTATKLGVGR